MAEQAICRIGDQCNINCNQHGLVTGTFDQGHPEYTIDDIPVVLIGHEGQATCGHRFKAITGSDNVDFDNIPIVRVTDQVEMIGVGGLGVAITGSPNVKSN